MRYYYEYVLTAKLLKKPQKINHIET